MDVFEAIADPVRRGILERLNGRPLSAGEIAAGFTISRPAISRHLRVLREAGLVKAELVGRRQIYCLAPGPLEEVDAWLAQYRTSLPALLDALETEVYRTRRERRAVTSLHGTEGEQSA
jgi:DNA-binding transcriptional ArsR family regulator